MHVTCAISSRVSSIIHSPWSLYECMSDEGGIRACSRISGYHCSPVMTPHECATSPSSLSLMVMSELVLAIDVSVQLPDDELSRQSSRRLLCTPCVSIVSMYVVYVRCRCIGVKGKSFIRRTNGYHVPNEQCQILTD